jgi:RNA polymerase sigma-70 factor (ECF subfamily)
MSPLVSAAPPYHTPALNALIDQSRAGDRRAQQRLYQQYRQAMLRVAARITGDPADAEDVLQESFVRAFRGLAGFRGQSTFGAWLKRIVVHTALNHRRRRRLELVPLSTAHLEMPEDQQAASVWAGPSQPLRHALAQLPEGYRQVLQLYVFEGYDHEEIAHILQISEATSKSQFCRAKKKLRELVSSPFPNA